MWYCCVGYSAPESALLSTQLNIFLTGIANSSSDHFPYCSLLSEDEQREKSVSHHTVQQLIVEKEQALADLNSVEKSLADLFRRYEKMKEVLEGFRKVSHVNISFKEQS